MYLFYLFFVLQRTKFIFIYFYLIDRINERVFVLASELGLLIWDRILVISILFWLQYYSIFSWISLFLVLFISNVLYARFFSDWVFFLSYPNILKILNWKYNFKMKTVFFLTPNIGADWLIDFSLALILWIFSSY